MPNTFTSIDFWVGFFFGLVIGDVVIIVAIALLSSGDPKWPTLP